MTAVPGVTPTLPCTVDGPVFVTVVPARTAYEAAVPRSMGKGETAPALPDSKATRRSSATAPATAPVAANPLTLEP